VYPESVVRMKLFTLDHRFVLAKRGRLADKDCKSVSKALAALLGGQVSSSVARSV
jgi:hypothetical protein